jgi:hypothetical protein
MWILPERLGTEPRYEQKDFPEAERRGKLRLVVSPDGDRGSLTIGQDARLHVGTFDAGESAVLPLEPGRAAWLHVARGSVELNGTALGPGDGAAVRGESELRIEGRDGGEVVLWTLPDA